MKNDWKWIQIPTILFGSIPPLVLGCFLQSQHTRTHTYFVATQLYLTPRAIALPAYPPHPDSPVCLFTQCAASQAAVGQNTLLLDRATESRSNCSGWTTARWYWTLNFKACNNFFPPHLAYLSFTMPVHRYTEHCYWLINRQRERMLSFKGWFQFIATCALFFIDLVIIYIGTHQRNTSTLLQINTTRQETRC